MARISILVAVLALIFFGGASARVHGVRKGRLAGLPPAIQVAHNLASPMEHWDETGSLAAYLVKLSPATSKKFPNAKGVSLCLTLP